MIFTISKNWYAQKPVDFDELLLTETNIYGKYAGFSLAHLIKIKLTHSIRIPRLLQSVNTNKQSLVAYFKLEILTKISNSELGRS